MADFRDNPFDRVQGELQALQEQLRRRTPDIAPHEESARQTGAWMAVNTPALRGWEQRLLRDPPRPSPPQLFAWKAGVFRWRTVVLGRKHALFQELKKERSELRAAIRQRHWQNFLDDLREWSFWIVMVVFIVFLFGFVFYMMSNR
jgi:hypothetical protein